MSITSTITDIWRQWASQFDEGISYIPVIGAWFRPKWTSVILDRDGQFSQADGHGTLQALSEDQVRQLAQKKRLCLRLGQGLGKQRIITLPQAARNDPAATIALSLKQYFPFPEDDTAFAVHGSGKMDEANQWRFAVSFARKSIIEEAMSHAASLGLSPKVVDALGDNPLAEVNADLLSGGKAGGGKSASKILFALCALFILMAMVINGWTALTLAPTAAQLDALAKPGGTDQARLQKQAKDTAPAILDIWQAATDALPDNAYAEYLTYENGRLRIAGKADDAAMLVNAIESQSIFSGTSFAAASLKEDDGKESFDLTTRVQKRTRP
ncbi:MAG: hypothetical protein COA84_10825 [Robiginitomaculum sp.]|nr:MAG: hypothetical protein COA84_10825 [Robiginitomaculum sp.]